jgi:hypothetical protein
MDYDDDYDYEPDYGRIMDQIMVFSVQRMKKVFKQQILVDEDADVGLDWEQREEIRSWHALTSPASSNTDIYMRQCSVATLSIFASFVTAHGRGSRSQAHLAPQRHQSLNGTKFYWWFPALDFSNFNR